LHVGDHTARCLHGTGVHNTCSYLVSCDVVIQEGKNVDGVVQRKHGPTLVYTEHELKELSVPEHVVTEGVWFVRLLL